MTGPGRREPRDAAAIAALKELAGAHALGALTAPEAAEIEREILRLDELAAEVGSMREVAAHLATGTPPSRPPAELKQQILARVRKESQGRMSRASAAVQAPREPRVTNRLALTLLVIAIGVGAAGGYLYWRAQNLTVEVRRQVADLQFARVSLAMRVQYREGVLGKVMTPGTQIYELTAVDQGVSPAPVVQVLWVKDRSQWLVNATHLSPAPQGKNYQLWYVVNGQTTAANVFNTDQEGNAFFALDLPPEALRASQAIVTVEPEGGSAQPTAPPLLQGPVTR